MELFTAHERPQTETSMPSTAHLKATTEDVQKWLAERGMVMIDKDEIRDIDCHGELAKLLREHGIGLYYRCSYL